MNWPVLLGVPCLLVTLGALAVWLFRRSANTSNPETWPATEATIQSMHRAIGSGRGADPVDVGDFSYAVNGEYYSGSAVISRSFSTRDSEPRDLIDKKFQVQYDPSKPEKYDVSESEIEGFELGPYDDFLMNDIDMV
jgi:Protein of unknown function (DUF3592)